MSMRHDHDARARTTLGPDLAAVRARLDAEGATGVLATIAFLVVFRVLIKDFFWIAILISPVFDFVRLLEWGRSNSDAKLWQILTGLIKAIHIKHLSGDASSKTRNRPRICLRYVLNINLQWMIF